MGNEGLLGSALFPAHSCPSATVERDRPRFSRRSASSFARASRNQVGSTAKGLAASVLKRDSGSGACLGFRGLHLPAERVVGISKLAGVLHGFARRLQV